MKHLCLFVTLLAVLGCSQPPEEAEQALRPVRYVLVGDSSAFRDRVFTGTSKSSTESRLSFKIGGTVTSVPVQIGQRLRAGDLIAEIDPVSYALQEQQAQAALVEAEANNRRAAANYERTKGLYANDNASLTDLEAARAQAEAADAIVASASKSLEIARLNVSYTKLRADTDCSIATLDVEVNENVSSGQQVAAVSCGDTYEVVLDLPETVISRIEAYTPVSIRFGAIPGRVFDGEVTEVSVASTRNSAAFPVVVRIAESDPALRSGLAADVTFQLDASPGGHTFVVPVSSIINDPDGTFVFVAEPNGGDGEAVVSRRPVQLGELSQQGVEVVDGVSVGDRIITAGVSVIRDGQRVLIPESS